MAFNFNDLGYLDAYKDPAARVAQAMAPAPAASSVIRTVRPTLSLIHI